jgi:hypothetical protein
LALVTAMPSEAATTAEPGLQRVFYYPGSVCQPASSAAAVMYTQFGITNTGSAPTTIVCPLPTSETRLPHSTGTPFGTPGVRINENIFRSYAVVEGAMAQVMCRLRNLDKNGNVIWQTADGSTSTGTLDFIVFTNGFGTLRQFADFWDITCTVPSSGAYLTLIAFGVEQP